MFCFCSIIFLCLLPFFTVHGEAKPDILTDMDECIPLSQNIGVDRCEISESMYCYNSSLCPETCGLFFLPFAEYAVGRTIGVDDDYGHFGLLIADSSCGIHAFAQGDVYIFNNGFNDGRWASSIGGGVRYVDPCFNRVWGVNGFYDYRRGCVGNFHQFGIGFESLSCTWDLRANFYFPVGSCKGATPVVFDDFQGDFFATCQFTEFAPCAVNAEIGRWCCLCNSLKSYQGVGPYFLSFGSNDYTAGVYYRGIMQYCQWLAAEIFVTHDSVFDTRVQGLFRLTIPFNWIKCCFSPACLTPCNRRVERFDMIPLSQDCCWTWNW